jgi:alpha-N-arabinofuranosidase
MGCALKLVVILYSATLTGSLALSQMSESSSGLQDKPIMIRVSRTDMRQGMASTLFGSFLESIGHSTYGGLWANIVENSSFEEGLWSAENFEAQPIPFQTPA